MKSRFAKSTVLVGTLLSACHRKEHHSVADLKTVSACMAAQRSHDDYVLATKCEPLGPEAKMQGTWVVGLEISVFRKNYMGVPADLGTSTDNQYELVARAALERSVHENDPEGPSAYQMSFEGRESALPKLGGAGLLVADRVLSLRRVPISPTVSKPPS